MLRLENVHKSYPGAGEPVHVLKGVDLTVETGELVSIMGSSGSGKSTLLNVLGLLDGYDAGAYHLDGTLIGKQTEAEAAQHRNRTIGFVFQSFNLLPFKTAVENVALPLYYRGVPRKQRLVEARTLLGRLGLADRADHLPTQLSGGQQQRVAIARALVTRPRLILADEPTGALDTETSDQIIELFGELHREGMTIVIVTHENDVAARTKRVIRLRDGRVEA